MVTNSGPMNARRTLVIELANGTKLEKVGEVQLRRLLQNFDLLPVMFTDRVRIESYVIPHSHPVLTLNTRYINDDDSQLATFIHEQLHWFESSRESNVEAAIEELRKRYRCVPEADAGGAQDEYNTYLHLVVCRLEARLLSLFIGEDRAAAVLASYHHYRWVYDRCGEDAVELDALTAKHGLEPPLLSQT